MAYPSTSPSYTTPDSSKTLAQDHHTARHTQEEADIVALAAKVGTGASTPTNNTVLRGNGTGTTEYAKVSLSSDVADTLPVANGGTGTTTDTGTGAVVKATSPTITTPTIASFTNAQHNHANAAGGGQLGTAALQDDSVTGAKIQLANNEGLEALNSGGTAKQLFRLDNDNYLRVSQLPYQSNTTNSTKEDVLEQEGWGFMTGTGATFASKSVTFPVAFDTLLSVQISCIGYKDGSDPTSITDFGTWEDPNVNVGSPTTSGFTAYVGSISSTAIASSRRIGFCWRARGIKA